MDVKFTVIVDAWAAYIRAIRLQSIAFGVAISHKDELIAVGEEDVVETFEAAIGQRCTMLIQGYAHSLAFSPDETILVTGCLMGNSMFGTCRLEVSLVL
jgi:hypothetical protein